MQDIHFRRHYVRHLPKEVSQNDIIKALASPLINDGARTEFSNGSTG